MAMAEARIIQIKDPVDASRLHISPTPVGDDISDFHLAQERLWSFENLTNKPTKRKTRKSEDGQSSKPAKCSSPGDTKAAVPRSTRKEVVMKRPSIWADVRLILLVVGGVIGLLGMVYEGVDWF